jgi:Helix-turn-helix domain
VTVGESLTEARYQAGLTVDELSERTRIRDSVIRSIERDDYEACGGDLYVRGYVRAIAGAVGIDAQPLIREFDQERLHPANGVGAVGADGGASGARPYVPLASATAAPSDPPGGDPDATSLDLPPVPASVPLPVPASATDDGQDPDETRFDLPAVREDPFATRFDLPPVRADHTEDMMAAGYDLQPDAGRAGAMAPPPDAWTSPVARADAPATSHRMRRGDRRLLIGAAAVIVLAIVVVVVVRLTSGTTSAKNAADSSSAKAAGLSAAAHKSAPAHKSAAASPTHTAAAKPTAKPVKSAPAPQPPASKPVTLLPVAAAYAFGPGGLGDGDNQSVADYAIARNPPLPWSTNWYTTPQFGMLKHGTGLLLSLGHQDTITSVLIDLTQYQGVNLQLQVGDGTAVRDFTVAATADNTGGTVRLTLRHPASARYLLIWFTKLPPNGAGQYQESVYHVLVNGRG